MREFVLFYYQWTSIIYWSKLFFDMSKSKLMYFISSNLLHDLPSDKYMFSEEKKKKKSYVWKYMGQLETSP